MPEEESAQSKKMLISHVTEEDLFETPRLVKWINAHPEMFATKQDILNIFGAAEHCLQEATQNVPGMFYWMVTGKNWHTITPGQYRSAQRRIDEGVKFPPRNQEPPRKSTLATVREAAAHIGCCKKTLYNLLDKGKIRPLVREGSGALIWIEWSEIHRYMSTRSADDSVT